MIGLESGSTKYRARWPVEKLATVRRRFERTLAGEVLISGLVALILVIGVTWNLPESEAKRQLTPVLRPIASAAGLEQSWRMYAPEPIRRLEHVEVRVTTADGDIRVWTNERGDPVIGVYAWYHWQKLKENLVREPEIRAGVAHWVVQQLTGRSEEATRVEMILRTELLPPPGANRPRTTAVETLYDEILTGQP